MENNNVNNTNVSAEEISELIEARRKKKRYACISKILLVVSVGLLITAIFMGVQLQQSEAKVAKIEYEPVKTETDQFYPGRAQGDYSDTCFDMNGYLNSIGATSIQRAIYRTDEGTKQKLLFTLDDFDWTIETTIFGTGYADYGIYTAIEAKNRITGRLFRLPTENCGTIIMDANSPFWFDWLAFDVFHAATDPNCELVEELRTGMDDISEPANAAEIKAQIDSKCPFYGLGVPHYDKDPATGDVSWHDDLGQFTVEEGLDLHY